MAGYSVAVEGDFGALGVQASASPTFTRQLWVKIYETFSCAFDERLWVEPKNGCWDVYVQPGVTPNKIVVAMRRLGITVYTYRDDLDRAVSTMDDLDRAVLTNDRDPIKGPYRVRFRARVEADEENHNLSADDLVARNIKGITFTERLLMELAYFLITEEKSDIHDRHLDRNNVTLCSGSRGSGGSVPMVHWGRVSRKVYVNWCHTDHQGSYLRSRSAVS